MGNWQLEVFKFGIYLAFPVGAFYAYNNKVTVKYDFSLKQKSQCFDLRQSFQVEWFKDYLYYFEKKSQSPKMRENTTEMAQFQSEVRELENTRTRVQLEREAMLAEAIKVAGRKE